MYFDNDEKIKKTNQEDKKKLDKKMALYGHTECTTNFFQTKDYENLLITFIKTKTPRIYNYGLPPKSPKKIRKEANKFLITKTKGINRTVLYLDSYYKLVYDFVAKYGEITEDKYDTFISYLIKNSQKIDVTKLPITWMAKDARNGSSNTLAEYLEDNLEFIKKFPIISKGISLTNHNDILGATTLVHEMTHALTDRHKGIVKNILHDEVLTIYMQLLAAHEIDPSGKLLKTAMLARLQSTKASILTAEKNHYNGYTDNTNEKYIISSLHAFNLFENYKNASDISRTLITNEINETLKGERTLEETLEKLESTEEEGSKIVKSYVKKIMK